MSLGKGAGGPPPALSYADERGLLEELEQAAAGQMDFRGGGERGDALQDLSDRNLLPYVSVFEARNDALATHAASSPATVAAYAPHQESPFLRSPSKPLTRRDEIEAESVLDAQNVQVSYAQMMTRLGLDSLQGKPLQDCLRSSLAELEGFCLKRSYQLGGLCRKMMHNTMKYVSYKQAASEVRQEAATWCLLRHLFFEEPVLREAAGGGGDAMDLGDGGDGGATTSTATDFVTEAVLQDEETRDAANVVSWLEFLAGLDLDEGHQGGLPKVGAGDGVWTETRAQCSIGGGEGLAELDPDAPSRQGRPIRAEDAKDSERVLRVVWRLLRSGRLRDACNICRECGQPWRAASLSAGGGVGLIAVGEAAASRAFDPANHEREFEASADELGLEPGTRRFLWKLSCLGVSESSAPSPSTAGAVGGAGGAAPNVSYEAATYGALCGNTRKVLPACTSWEDVLWAHARALLESRVDEAVLTGLSRASGHAAQLWRDGRPAGTPRTMEEVFGALSAADSGGQERDQMQRQLQALLVLRDYDGLLACLRDWILHPSDHEVGEFSFAEPPAPPTAMRFAAHLVLFLRFLGIVGSDSPSSDDASNEFGERQDLVNKVLQVYVIHLMDTEQHDLIPVYAAHLRDTSLDLTYMIFLDEMMKYSLVEQQKAYALACKYLGGSVPRLVCKYARKVMEEARGPVEENAEHRAQACLWLCYEESLFHSALSHSVSLCRDFCLGGVRSHEAASTLLLQVLPPEFWRWLEALKFEGSHADANRMDLTDGGTAAFMALARELEDWKTWFEHQDSVRKWSALFSAASSASREALSAPNAQSLRREGERLLERAMGLLTGGWLQTTASDAGDPNAVGVTITCAAVEKPAGQEGIGFAADAQIEGFDPTTLQDALNNALGSEGGHYAASCARGGEPGKFELKLRSASGKAAGPDLEAAAYILGWAIKGDLSEDLSGVGLCVQHLDCGENQAACRFLCRQCGMSKLLLQCIYVRQVLSGLPGDVSPRGRDLVKKIVGCDESVDLTHYLSPFQVQELVLMEREAAINEMEAAAK